jgi:recombination directionality factor gp3-like protein
MLRTVVQRLRPPRLGVIHLGVQREKQNPDGTTTQYPEEVPYFVLPDDLKAEVVRVSGVHDETEITRLPVLLPSNEPDGVLSASYTKWAKGRHGRGLCIVRCDGQTCVEMPREGGTRTYPCKRPTYEPGKATPECECGAKAQARLNVIPLDGRLGVYQVVMGGEQRIADLYGELLLFRARFGRLTDIIFEIERRPAEVQIEQADGRRLTKTGWPVHLTCATTVKAALGVQGVDVKSLPGGEIIDEAEGDSAPLADAPPDISLCYAIAARLGLTPDEYARYFAAKYKHAVDDYTDAEVTEQLALLRDCETNEARKHQLLTWVRNGSTRPAGGKKP